ncbi:hypothetical protein Tco_0080471 [Tanacetum coccineum]
MTANHAIEYAPQCLDLTVESLVFQSNNFVVSHSPPDEGTRKSQPFLEGKTTNLKDSEGNKHPTDKGLPCTVPDEIINLETLEVTTTIDIQALLGAFDDDLNEDSEDDVFEAGKEMDEDI